MSRVETEADCLGADVARELVGGELVLVQPVGLRRLAALPALFACTSAPSRPCFLDVVEFGFLRMPLVATLLPLVGFLFPEMSWSAGGSLVDVWDRGPVGLASVSLSL